MPLYDFDVRTVLVFGGAFLSAWLYLKSLRPRNFPPGPTTLPIVGNLAFFSRYRGDFLKAFRDLSVTYGPIIGLKLGSRPAVVLTSVDAIKEAFGRNADLSARPSWLFLIQSIVYRKGQPRGVIWQNGQNWKDTRRFTLQSLRDFGVGKRSIEERIVEEAEMLCNEIGKHGNVPFDITEITQEAVSNVICSVCFGSRFEYDDARFQRLLGYIRENVRSASFISPVNFFPFLRVIPIHSWVTKVKNNLMDIEQFVLEQIEDHRKSFDPEEIRDFVDLYLEKEREGHGDDQIYSSVNLQRVITDLFIAGTETTSTTIRWVLVYLVTYTDAQSQCHKQIDKNVGSGRAPNLADRAALPYVEAVISETLRIASVVPLGVPHSAERDTTLCDYHIPKDTIVIANLHMAHNDPTYWNSPKLFRPERWLGDDGSFRKADGLLTFSIGPRTCLGEMLARNELFLFLSTLLQRYTVRVADHQQELGISGKTGITYSPVDYQFVFAPRD